jgi:hypothetical protein
LLKLYKQLELASVMPVTAHYPELGPYDSVQTRDSFSPQSKG